MNDLSKNAFIGNWTEIREKIQQNWAQLCDDDLKRIEGNIEELSGRIQKKYGYTKEQAESEVSRFKAKSLSDESFSPPQSRKAPNIRAKN